MVNSQRIQDRELLYSASNLLGFAIGLWFWGPGDRLVAREVRTALPSWLIALTRFWGGISRLFIATVNLPAMRLTNDSGLQGLRWRMSLVQQDWTPATSLVLGSPPLGFCKRYIGDAG